MKTPEAWWRQKRETAGQAPKKGCTKNVKPPIINNHTLYIVQCSQLVIHTTTEYHLV